MTMPTDATPPADTVTTFVVTGPGGEQGQPEDKTDYKVAYAGLQKHHQKIVEQSRTELQSLNTKMVELQAQLSQKDDEASNAKHQLTTMEAQVKEINEKLNAVSSEKSSLEGTLTRAQLIASEFPELASFERAGLLPSPAESTPDALRTAFTTFRTTLGQVRGDAAASALSGVTPPAPPSTPGGSVMNREQLYAEAMKASREGREADYDRYMDLLMKA